MHGPNLARCQRHRLAYTGSPCSRIRLAKRVKSLSDNTSTKPSKRPVCRRYVASMTCTMSGEFFPSAQTNRWCGMTVSPSSYFSQRRGRVPEKSPQLRLTLASVPCRRRVS